MDRTHSVAHLGVPVAFTLVELLVVVTIIVLLVAMLVPSLEDAVRQAQLAACGSQLKSIAVGALGYADDNQGLYPYRPSIALGNWKRPNNLNDGTADGSRDDRPYLKNHIDLAMLVDPLSGQVDLKSPPSDRQVFSNYSLWFGMTYPEANGGGALLRVTDRLAYEDRPFSVLASDDDSILTDLPGPNQLGTHASHADALRKQQFVLSQEEFAGGFASSRWEARGTFRRGVLDTNFVYVDGSVNRYTGVAWDEADRSGTMRRVPMGATGAEITVFGLRWTHVPSR